MRRRFVLVLACILPACDDEPVAQPIEPGCSAGISAPFDGQTAVRLETVVTLSNVFDDGRGALCGRQPIFLRDDGAEVPFALRFDPQQATATIDPSVSLDPDRTYTVDLGFPTPFCGAPPTRISFRTGPAPKLRRVFFETDFASRWYGSIETVAAVRVEFSEPVRTPEELASADTGVSVLFDGSPRESAVATADQLGVTFKLSQEDAPPRTTQPVRIRVAPGLAFSSGVALTGPSELELVPADLRLGWAPPGSHTSEALCQFGSDCATAPAVPAALAALAMLALRPRPRRKDRR